MARENHWGYPRIVGELKKLDITISASCVAEMLRRNGLPPSPERKGLTWRELLRRHADVLLCADLFTKEIWTFCGLRCAFVLVVMHVKSRTILLAEVTYHAPNANSFAERWIRSVRQECLNHLILFGIKSLRRVVHTYARFHNEHRSHQGIGNRVPASVRAGEPTAEAADGPVGEVHCEEYLGGLLKSYHRAAA